MSLPAGACLQVNTGGPIPLGADAVVMVEQARPRGGAVVFETRPEAGEHIEHRASLRRAGQPVARAGACVDAGVLAALAAGGHASASVYAAPDVAILSTGDELTGCGARLAFGQIHDSNALNLAELVRRCGGQVALQERCPDDAARLRAALERGLAHTVSCVVGGMSVGTRDLAPGLLSELGVAWLVRSLDLKPGKPTRIGRSPGGGWVIGLPGNPVSCTACFLLFARAILAGLQGRAPRRPRLLRATIADEMPANGRRPMYQPGAWDIDDGGRPIVRPVMWRGSGDPFGMAGANCLIYRPERAAALATGAQVDILVLEAPL